MSIIKGRTKFSAWWNLGLAVAALLVLSQAKGVAQGLLDKPVSLRAVAVTVPEALGQLAKGNGIPLAYSEQFFRTQKKVTVKARHQPAKQVLTDILAGTGVGFRELGGQVVLYLLPEEQPALPMTLSGFVEDAETGERLIAATVYCPELGVGTVTNEYGFYSLTLPPSARYLRFNYVGYNEELERLSPKQHQHINRALRPSLFLAEVIVTPSDTALGNLLPSPGSLWRFKPEDFKATPDLGGQSDLLRVMQMLPGVQTGSDGAGGMFVRGGNADQNLVLLDGVPVYNADHLLGLFSIFNTSAVRSAKLLKGGIPARYGGRISSVLDVYTKDGNQHDWSGEVASDLIGAKATVEGPFANKKGSLLVSGRRTHSDFYLMPAAQKFLSTENMLDKGYFFYDFNTKLNYRFSDKDKVYLSFYRGKDLFEGREELVQEGSTDNLSYQVDWGNTITSLRWNHLFHPKLFSNTSLTYSHFEFATGLLVNSVYETGPDQEPFVFSFFSGLKSEIRDLAWKTDFDYAPSPNQYLRFGASIATHRFQPNVSFIQEEGTTIEFIDSFSVADYLSRENGVVKQAASFDAYVEDEWRLGDRLAFNTGLRLSGFYSDGKPFLLPEPRIGADFRLSKKIELTASITRTSQYLHRITTAGLSFPGDYWTPSNKRIAPQKAWQGTLGIEGKLPDGLAFSLEAYYKNMEGLLAFPDSFLYDPVFGDIDPEDFFISSRGKSRGLEFLLRREEGRIGGWLGYSLAKSTRQSDLINIGKPYPFHFDRRHEVKLFGFYRLDDHWQASFNWAFGSPNPQFTDEGKLPAPPGQDNHLRGNAYHRLDLALSFSTKTAGLEHQFKASLFNAYNRKNVVFYQASYDEFGNYSTKPVYLFPLMLGLYYGLHF